MSFSDQQFMAKYRTCMLRIALISIISLAIVLLAFLFVLSLKEDEPMGLMVYVFILVMGGAFFPTLIAAFIFYLFVRKIDSNKITTREKIRISLFFILVCELGIVLWAAGESLLSGDPGVSDFMDRYTGDFNGWNLIILVGGALMSFLYFNNFLASMDSS